MDDIIIDYKSGLRLCDLKNKYNISSSTLIRLLKNANVFVHTNKKWNKNQIEFLKKNYSHMSWDNLCKKLQPFSKRDIIIKAFRLGIHRDVFFWDDQDVNYLIDNYSKYSIDYLYMHFDGKFTKGAIRTKAGTLGLRHSNRWSSDEINILLNNYFDNDADYVESLLPNRNQSSIYDKIKHLNLSGIKSNAYTEKDLAFIRDNYKNMTDCEMGKVLHRSKDSIKNKRNFLGLHIKTSGDYNSLLEYARQHNIEWKSSSMKNCNYKCVITNKRFDEIHHLQSMNLIVAETLKLLNLSKDINVDDLTNEDLNKFLITFKKIQASYPLGVCLSSDVHKQFHIEYGYGNNIPEQFYEFKKQFKIA